ncbi:hypothetical protein EJB05_24739 [Eragrostis curvula]|uniref:Uncharacterized protein n=1 Tax=Eragrostis curvula TaxID=38414 RepID=A0A5J9VBU6_9POAL|nr:hypothetical protein EJB05_24739 [Eragrostis curvula]
MVDAIMDKKMRAEKYSIKKCLDTTDCMEELTDEDKAIASEVFEDDKNKEMFMKHKNHNVRLLWLRRKITALRKLTGLASLYPSEMGEIIKAGAETMLKTAFKVLNKQGRCIILRSIQDEDEGAAADNQSGMNDDN